MGFQKVNRRTVLLALGGAGVLASGAGLYFAVSKQRQKLWAKPVDRGGGFSPSVYLAIEASGDVTIWLTKTEMGQGVMTALPLILAEELDADWQMVQVKTATLDDVYDYGSMFTAASGSVTSLWTELRHAGAAARAMLLQAGAEHLGVVESECRTEAGQVIHKDSKRSVNYGTLVNAASELSPPFRPNLKDPAQFKLVGKSVPRVDIPAKVNGTATFGIDVRVEGALFAALRRCPVHGGKLVSAETSQAEAVSGVKKIIRLESAVAVVADSTWAALEGARRLHAQWDTPEYLPQSEELHQKLLAVLDEAGVVVSELGDLKLAKDKTLDATYEVPFLAHAPMEPLNSTVRISGDRCELWVPTQNPEGVRNAAAGLLGIPPENVTVHRTLVGGGFGRRTNTDESEEAVQVAQRLGHPVHLLWTREDDIQHDFYREAAAHRMEGSLNAQGNQLQLLHRIASLSSQLDPEHSTTPDSIAVMGASDIPYALTASKVEWHGVKSPVRVGIWRSVGYSHNTFALESFVDELAAQRRIDPIELRRNLLPQGSRLRLCLERVAQMSEWSSRRESPLGVAICSCFGSHIALVLEATVSESDQPRVRRVWAAADCGLQIHPDNIKAQIEGGIMFGLSAALLSRITVTQGAVTQSNFHDYKVLRQSDAPPITVDLVPSGAPPSGIGELSVPVVAPALCNALFRLTGKRHRTLPLIG